MSCLEIYPHFLSQSNQAHPMWFHRGRAQELVTHSLQTRTHVPFPSPDFALYSFNMINHSQWYDYRISQGYDNKVTSLSHSHESLDLGWSWRSPQKIDGQVLVQRGCLNKLLFYFIMLLRSRDLPLVWIPGASAKSSQKGWDVSRELSTDQRLGGSVGQHDLEAVASQNPPHQS